MQQNLFFAKVEVVSKNEMPPHRFFFLFFLKYPLDMKGGREF
jgi:hypothetical protein